MMIKLLRIRGHAVWVPPLSSTSVIVDAGAHRGEFSEEMHHRFGCRCIAVEANPLLAKQLEAPPGGQVIRAALTASDGTASFIFRENPEGGGVTPQDLDQGNSTCLIETLSLATLMDRIKVAQLDLLKLDIEGAEFALLEQVSDALLLRISQITVEFHDFLPEFKGRGLFEAVRTRLERLGFLCCPMAFNTHGDILFLNLRSIQLNKIDRLGVRYAGRILLKLRDLR